MQIYLAYDGCGLIVCLCVAQFLDDVLVHGHVTDTSPSRDGYLTLPRGVYSGILPSPFCLSSALQARNGENLYTVLFLRGKDINSYEVACTQARMQSRACMLS